MLKEIEQLLVLQDRDRKIRALQAELRIAPTERKDFEEKFAVGTRQLEAAKLRAKEIELERKKLENEAESKRTTIAKYNTQKFQTRKNEEYRALAHEIDMAKTAIHQIEDQEIELMEQGEAAQKQVAAATAAAAAARQLMEGEVSALAERETNLHRELESLEQDRDKLASAVEPGALHRYERLFKSKGQNVVVGVHKGMCGGCHMKLPAQVLVDCKSQDKLVDCTNCSRILYYTRDMDMVVAE
jgi:predicted  nucleic acid-binding Zn-ribbon protein